MLVRVLDGGDVAVGWDAVSSEVGLHDAGDRTLPRVEIVAWVMGGCDDVGGIGVVGESVFEGSGLRQLGYRGPRVLLLPMGIRGRDIIRHGVCCSVATEGVETSLECV